MGVSMIIWAVAATLVCIALSLAIIMILRQIGEICRRLSFIRSHRTNMKLAADTPFPAMNGLINEINSFLEEAAEKRMRMERESRGLKDSLTGISHDIRTPLTSLSGYFQLLTREEEPEERARYCAVIRARIDSLESMLEELFTYTKLQNSDYRIEMDSVNFTRCVIDTMLAFYGQFADKNMQPEVTVEEEAAYIYGNPEAVRRILQNILKNALVHGTGGMSVSLHREQGRVVFRCANRCESPEEINVEEVFCRFYKADSVRKDTSTGLGLTIAAELARRMRGGLTADLQKDIFSITATFPLFAGGGSN